MTDKLCPVTKEFCSDLQVIKVNKGVYVGTEILWCKEINRDTTYLDYCIKRLSELGGREKIQRMLKLKKLGLNCPEYIVIRRGSDTSLLEKEKEWSIRSFPFSGVVQDKTVLQALKGAGLGDLIESNVVPPHAPAIETEDAKEFCWILLNYNFHPMACPVINPKDAMWAGCALRTAKGVRMELAYGPVMVRKVSRDGEIDITYNITRENLELMPDFSVGFAARIIMEKVPVGSIVEVSLYKVDVGYKKENIIFWDVMPRNKYLV